VIQQTEKFTLYLLFAMINQVQIEMFTSFPNRSKNILLKLQQVGFFHEKIAGVKSVFAGKIDKIL